MTISRIGTRKECEDALRAGKAWDGERVVAVRIVGEPSWRRAGREWRVDAEAVPA